VEFALLITKLKGNAVILYPNTYYVTLGPPTKPKEKNPAGSRTRRPLWSSRLRSPTSPLHAPHVLHATSPPHNSRPPRTHFTSPPPPTPPPYNRSRAALGDRLVGGRGSMHPLVEALVGERRHWAPALRHAAAWAGTLALAVSVASFAPEAAFVWSLAGGGAGARACPVGSACACRRGWRGGPAPTCSCRRRSRGSPSAPPRVSCARSPSGAGTTSTSRPLLERRVLIEGCGSCSVFSLLAAKCASLVGSLHGTCVMLNMFFFSLLVHTWLTSSFSVLTKTHSGQYL
jgi:hypothetical protein